MDRIQQTSEHRPGTIAGLRVREVAWVVIAQAGVPLASVASVKLFTKVLLPSEYGTVAIVLSYVVVALYMLLTPVGGPSAVFIHQLARVERVRELLGTTLGFSVMVEGLIVVGLVILTVAGPAVTLDFPHTVILYGALVLGAEVIKGPAVSLINTGRLRKQYALISILDGWGKLLLAMLLISFLGHTFQSLLLAYAINAAVVAFVGWRALFNSSYGRIRSVKTPLFSARLLYSLLKSGWPYVGIGLATWAMTLSDRALLGAMVPAHDVGIYAASYQIASVLPMAFSSFMGLLVLPVIYQRYARSPAEAAALIGQSVGYSLWLLVPITFIPILGNDALIRLLAGHGYEPGAPVIWWVTPALALAALVTITNMPFWLRDRSSTHLIISMGAAACNVLFNLIFIPRIGFIAAAVSTFVAYLLLFVATTVAGRQMLEWRIPRAHLWAAGIGIAMVIVVFILSGREASLAHLGLYTIVYLISSMSLLLLMDEPVRAAVRIASRHISEGV